MAEKNAIPVHRANGRSAFSKLNNKLNKRGFVALDTLKPGLVRSVSLGDRDPSEAQANDMAAGMNCGNLSNGPLMKVAWAFDNITNKPTSVSDENGQIMGRGYIPWGPFDNLPSTVYSLAKALPYTAAPLKYLADLASGLGVTFLYRFANGDTVDYRDAGEVLLEKLEKLETQKANTAALKRARKAYEEWKRTWEGEDVVDFDGMKRHIPGVREFIENNNLDLHLSQCMQDDMMFDLYFPTVGLERGRRGKWDPRIVRLSLLKITDGIRYEMMNEYRHIEHVYFGERFKTKGPKDGTANNSQKLTMYPVAESQGRVAEMRYIVESNQRTRIKDRPTWVAWPTYYGNKNYYQQPAWWSIWTSKAFDFSSTILYDKYKQRENNTTWGRIIYISLDYLEQVFSDEGYQGNPDAQQEFIDELELSMENFLSHRENTGKTMRQWMWLGQDGKEHHNVEIVDVNESVQDAVKAGKEELELATSPIFLAFGVDPRDIGVPMVAASNGGTALREIRLMKQQLLNVRQRAYVRLLEDIRAFNRWDEHLTPAIKQMTFTTLDASKTGTIETIAGDGA